MTARIEQTPGRLLREARERTGLTQEALRILSGVSAKRISEMEHDHVPISVTSSVALAGPLDLEPDLLAVASVRYTIARMYAVRQRKEREA